VIQYRTSVHFSSLDRNDFLTTTLIAFGIEHIQCAAIFETKDFPRLALLSSMMLEYLWTLLFSHEIDENFFDDFLCGVELVRHACLDRITQVDE
jgi:hypothetical protein